MKFPTEFDAVDIVTDELKEKLLPVNRKIKDIERERAERRKMRKGEKKVADTAGQASEQPSGSGSGSGDVEMSETVAAPVHAPEDESVAREKELKDLDALIHPDLKADVGCSVNGLYELIGASV